MRSLAITRTYRHLRRYEEIVRLLVKHGFGDLLHSLGVETFVEAGLESLVRRKRAHEELSTPRRVRRLLEELGPTFIKAGQFLSTRSDLLPAEYLEALSGLQDDLPPFPFEQARAIVEGELGAPLGRIFRRFDREPVAAASIGQIHKADLADGTRLVVKIRRPEIERTVAADLEIMAHLAGLAERHLKDWAWRRPVQIVKELSHSLRQEMDFSVEAAHMERFAREFQGDPAVKVPFVRRQLSTSRVLCMERVSGLKADDVEGLQAAGIDPRDVASLLARQYLVQIFRNGFFHSDPHPGNLFILPGPVVCYLDFGQAGRLDRETREILSALLLTVAERDAPEAVRQLLRLSLGGLPADPRAVERDIEEVLDQYAYRPLQEWRLGRILQQLFEASGRHRLRVPPELFLLIKAIGALEAVTRTLDPRFDVIQVAGPFIRGLEAERLAPRRLLEEALDGAESLLRAARGLPELLERLVRRAREGRLALELEHKGLDVLSATLERVGNRLSFSVVLAALLVGSALLVHAGIPPYWRGVPILGLGGFLLSGAMALWLLAAIIRHGRM